MTQDDEMRQFANLFNSSQSESLGDSLRELFVYVMQDDDDNEAIPAFDLPELGTFPLLANGREKLEELRPIAQQVSNALGLTLRLMTFQLCPGEEEEVIYPLEEV